MPNDAPKRSSHDGAGVSEAGPAYSAETIGTDEHDFLAPSAPDEELPAHTLAEIADRDTNGWNQGPRMLRVPAGRGAVVVMALVATSLVAGIISNGSWFRSALEAAAGVSATTVPSGPSRTATSTPSPTVPATPSASASASPTASSPAPDSSAPSATAGPEQDPGQQARPENDGGTDQPDDAVPDPSEKQGETPTPADPPVTYSILRDADDGELRGPCGWAAGDMDLGDAEATEAGGRFELAYTTCPELGSYVATSRPAGVLGNGTSRPEPQDCEEVAHGGEPLDLRVDGGALPVGSTFCTTTDKGRIAYVVITGYTRNFSMTFDLTTWEIAD